MTSTLVARLHWDVTDGMVGTTRHDVVNQMVVRCTPGHLHTNVISLGTLLYFELDMTIRH